MALDELSADGVLAIRFCKLRIDSVQDVRLAVFIRRLATLYLSSRNEFHRQRLIMTIFLFERRNRRYVEVLAARVIRSRVFVNLQCSLLLFTVVRKADVNLAWFPINGLVLIRLLSRVLVE